MSIWFFVWLIISVALLYFSAWTFYILRQQKSGWKKFANEHGLRFELGGFFDAPSLDGVYKKYSVSMFTAQHGDDDVRNTRKLTAIEVEMNSTMPMQGAVASGGMIDIVNALGYSNEYKPGHKSWSTSNLIRTDDVAMMKAYLTDARIESISALMKVVNAWVIFIFKENKTLLRIDMANPLQDPKKLSVLLDKMVEVAKVLELTDGEAKGLEAFRNKPLEDTKAGLIDGNGLETDIGLELEEEEDVVKEEDEEKSSASEQDSEPALDSKSQEKEEPVKPSSES